MTRLRTLLGLALLVAGVLAADTTEAVVDQLPNGQGEINWTTGTITVTGLGPIPRSGRRSMPIQRRVAQVDAYRQLAEAVKGVHVTSESTVEMYELVSDTIRTTLDTFLKGQKVVGEGWMEDKETYQVTLTAPLYGGGDESVLTKVLPQVQPAEEDRVLADPAVLRERVEEANAKVPEAQQVKLPPVDQPKVDVPQPAAQPALPDDFPKNQQGPFTGLVVDCRGFQVSRAMAPKIMTSDEDEVWGTVSVSPDFVLSTGIVGYLPSLEMALGGKVSRAGENPLVVRCIGRQGSFRANAVVSDADAQRIRDEDSKSKFLSQFRVVFVIDAK